MPTTNHWQNNHRTSEARHHPCSENTTDMRSRSGIEVAIHDVRKDYKENSESLLLVMQTFF